MFDAGGLPACPFLPCLLPYPRTRLNSFVAVTACRVWYLPVSELRPLLQLHPKVLKDITASLQATALARIQALPKHTQARLLEAHDTLASGDDLDYQEEQIPGDVYFLLKVIYHHTPNLGEQLFRSLDEQQGRA